MKENLLIIFILFTEFFIWIEFVVVLSPKELMALKQIMCFDTKDFELVKAEIDVLTVCCVP